MKNLFIVIFVLNCITGRAQTLVQLQNALKSSDKTVQAIHGYPAHIDNGKCHWVPVTAIVVSGNEVTITETWHTLIGQATTTLTGKVVNGMIAGTWSSAYSSGTWSYSFTKNTGLWNKTQSVQEKFDDNYPLRLRIVNKQDVKDGPYDCN